ncbi:MAG: glutaredoxin 3 [Gammaproteobacteria bacterium]|nr:glutaredoxin 3 [Gammaproteobacteria bacterium]
MSANIEIYTTGYCGFCVRAKALLDRKELDYTEIRVDDEPEKRKEMMERSQRRTVPQIFINDEGIGGCDELFALDRSGKLDEMTKRNKS